MADYRRKGGAMTELPFLVDLLLNHKLPKGAKDAVAARIKEVAATSVTCGPSPVPTFGIRELRTAPAAIPPHMVGQSASTIAAMMKQEQAGGISAVPPEAAVVSAQLHGLPAPEPQPVAVVAQTPAAVAALAGRQAAIAEQISGKPEKGRTSPRKF